MMDRMALIGVGVGGGSCRRLAIIKAEETLSVRFAGGPSLSVSR